MSRRLRVSRLTLTHFRNYRDLRLDLEGGLVVLAGPNGAGKTNLLEAVSLLSPGRGLRNAPYEEIACHGGPGGWAVASRLEAEEGPVRLSTAWSPTPSSDTKAGPRTVAIEGVRQKSSGALAWHVSAIWLTPAMDRLFSGPASERRRFLDRLSQTLDPAHGSRVTAFEKLMRDRHIVLSGERRDSAWLSSLEAQMAEHAIAIAAGRQIAVEVLRSHILKSGPAGPFPTAELALEGDTESLLVSMPAVNAEDEYRRLLHDSRSIDAAI